MRAATFAVFAVFAVASLPPGDLGRGERGVAHASPITLDGTQSQDTITGRLTDITLVMGNSRRRAGNYHGSGIARICGFGPLRDFKGMVDGFTLSFPDGEDLEIIDVDFSADTLPVGRTTTSFYISIGLKAKQGGRPPDYVVRANQPKYGETGSATLTFAAGTHTLHVTGTNDEGETMDMTAVCKPKARPSHARALPPATPAFALRKG
ncbi:MAG: hypothetical protein FIB01_10200 [Gemmatimonadetes bacterium]|nr:hypothetical protein [Gemmatimonadota bacterium]